MDLTPLLHLICYLTMIVYCQQDNYRAAVYEKLALTNLAQVHLQSIMLESAHDYEKQASIASNMGVHLLIFPEYGITGIGNLPSTREEVKPYLQVLPSVEPGLWNPCLQDDGGNFNTTILKRLSCSAKNNGIALVVNVPTIVVCSLDTDPSCPPDGAYQFNTNVAIDVDGTVLATYHKINLYLEPIFDEPPYPSGHVTTFKTSVEVTFGLITCFDIMFYDPTVALVSDNGVEHIVMTTAWYDGLPFLTSVQSQMAWAVGLDINLMTANIQKSPAGLRGSGIYSGQHGYLNYTYGPRPEGVLIIADLPKNPRESTTVSYPSDDQSLLKVFDTKDTIFYDDLSDYTYLKLNNSGSASVTHGTFNCSIRYTFNETKSAEQSYYLAGYQGLISYGNGTRWVAAEVCALLWCKNLLTENCGLYPPDTTAANLIHLELTGNFSTGYVYPSILRSDLFLIDRDQWKFNKPNASEFNTSFQLVTLPRFSHQLFSASLYGRVYDSDPSKYQCPVTTDLKIGNGSK